MVMKKAGVKIRSGSAPGHGRRRQSGPALERLRWECSYQTASGHSDANRKHVVHSECGFLPAAMDAQSAPTSNSAASNAPVPSKSDGVDRIVVEDTEGNDAQLSKGTRVRLINLQSRPELNGKTGTIVAFHQAQCRWQVRLDNNSSSKLFKGNNLARLGDDDPRQGNDRSFEANLARLGAGRLLQKTEDSDTKQSGCADETRKIIDDDGLSCPQTDVVIGGEQVAFDKSRFHTSQNGDIHTGGAAPETNKLSVGPVQDSEDPGEESMASAFVSIYTDSKWLLGADALSGLGSREETTRPFCRFLENFLRAKGITSIVDLGCGHWPSGYQRGVDWGGSTYTGIDIVPRITRENRIYLERPSRLAAYGLRSACFMEADGCTQLPPADLLLVKDVLMHWPNNAVSIFLENHIKNLMPRYRYVMLVQNETPLQNVRTMIDIQPGQLLPFDIRDQPFEAEFHNVFSWQSDETKIVQLWEAPVP